MACDDMVVMKIELISNNLMYLSCWFEDLYHVTAFNATHSMLSQFCLSVCLLDVCIVIKRDNHLSISQHHTKRMSLIFPLQLGSIRSIRFFTFLNKFQFKLNKVCYKVSLCENFQRQSCRAVNQLRNNRKI